MDVKLAKELDTKQELLALGLFEEDKNMYKDENPELYQEIREAMQKKYFKHGFGETYVTKMHNSAYKKILVLSLGKEKELSEERIRRAASIIVKTTKSSKYDGFTTNILELSSKTRLKDKDIGRSAAEAFLLSNYEFSKYVSKEKRKHLVKKAVFSWNKKESEIKKGVREGIIIGDATNLAKDLVNESPSIANSHYIEKTAKGIAGQKKNVKLKILNEKEMKKLGMNALLAVNKGSDNPPKMLVMEYKNGKGPFTAILGKGITFDSGGINIKPTGYIEDMKMDMGGAAAVLGTMKAITELGVKKNVIGVMPLCENMINGSATRPGDIIKAYNGKTIEVKNTDAEGRLILADALSYTEDKYKPSVMIDLATLTGSVIIALGYYTSGMVTNNEELGKTLEEAGNKSYDRVWKLPFYEEYQDNMDGDITDLKNLSGKADPRAAGSITAGVFLSKFVEKARWAHIDIAGTAYLKEPRTYLQKHATGAGVRLLTYYFIK